MSHSKTIQRGLATTVSQWLSGCAALLLCCLAGLAQASDSQTVRISIIIDDMGGQLEAGLRALQLPGAITYAFLPHTPHSRSLANAAHHLNREVMLHLPMQAIGANKLGPGGLTLNMNRNQFKQTFQSDLDAIPHAVGINNHMGSLLTQHPGHMKWLMEAIKQRDNLYFIDSRTTHQTVANQLARESNIPSRQRDVFLDDDPNPEAINRQFKLLLRKANRLGSAIGIGHPYKSTLSVLAQLIPQLKDQHIILVPASQLVHQQPATHMALEPTPAPGPLVLKMPDKSRNYQ
ncbi:MAG TPA: divergent polysaccharide deacetylase family protein [Gammaproteobacteria bacterium]|nr:divergent polysaccharide deacetylase family protein [Gammaproteobacteria bacterium]